MITENTPSKVQWCYKYKKESYQTTTGEHATKEDVLNALDSPDNITHIFKIRPLKNPIRAPKTQWFYRCENSSKFHLTNDYYATKEEAFKALGTSIHGGKILEIHKFIPPKPCYQWCYQVTGRPYSVTNLTYPTKIAAINSIPGKVEDIFRIPNSAITKEETL